MIANRARINTLALAAKLPVVHSYRDNLGEGLISYGPDLLDLYRRAAGLVDKILRGTRPRYSGRAADQVRTGDQPQDGESARVDGAADVACPCRRGNRMRRREFLTVLGGVAASAPFGARAQERTRSVGMLLAAPEHDPDTNALMEMFRRSLETLGWSETRNLRIERRVASDTPKMRDYATELASLELDVIVTYPTPSTAAIKAVTSGTPIVFVNVADPIGSGFVDSLARPGGSITGFVTSNRHLEASGLVSCARLRPILPELPCFSILPLRPMAPPEAFISVRQRKQPSNRGPN